MKAGGKTSNWLARYFGLYKEEEGNGRVDLSSYGLAMGQNETTGALTRPSSKPV
jgi:hypothetical protein